MSVWKSPIVYVGITLVLLVVGLLSAPFIVNWNGYRAAFEDYGSRLTGRRVVISGDISARVFPWPRLRLEGVSIANPEGASNPNLVNAQAVEARMLLGSLISGHVEVSDIRVEKPVFALERLESGSASWWITPRLEEGMPIGAERISVENLEIVDGKILLSDSRRGGTAQLDDFDAVLSSQTLLGPWKARGRLGYRGQVLDLGISTGQYKSGEPFKFVLRLSPVDGPGLVYSFDGEYSAGGEVPVSGVLKAEPYVAENGKTDSEAQLKAVTFKSKLSLKENHLLLKDIEIAPADPQQLGNLLTGEAAIELESRISVRADLRTPRFDLDSVLGSGGRQVLKSGAVLEGLSEFIDLLPETLDGRLILNVGTLIAGGEKLESAKLEAELADRGLVIHELSAAMPGQTRGKFQGLFFTGTDRPQLSGDIELESANTREFLSWLMPEWKQAIAERWSGARGKLSFRSKLDHAPLSLRLSDSRFALDDSSLTGEMTLTGGDVASTDLRLIVDRLDLDRYFPEGLGHAAPDNGLASLAAGIAGAATGLGDMQLSAQAGTVLLNGAEARDLTADLSIADGTLDLRTIHIGSVGGAKLDIAAALSPNGDAKTGTASMKIEAADPRPLLRLFGMIKPGTLGAKEPTWAAELAPLNATLDARGTLTGTHADIGLTLAGTAGGSNLSGSGTFAGDPSDFRHGRVTLLADVTSPSAKKLTSLFGFTNQSDEQGTARLTLNAEGHLADGLQTMAELQALGAAAKYSGRLDDDGSGKALSRADGYLALEAADGDRVLRAFGIASPHPGARLRLTSPLTIGEAGAEFSDLRAWLDEERYEGRLSIGRGRMDVAARVQQLSVPWLLAFALMPADGAPLSDVKLFAPSLLGGLSGTIAIEAEEMTLLPGIAVKGGSARLKSDGEKLSLLLGGLGARGTPFRLGADLAREANELRVRGDVQGGFDLSEIFSAPDGEPVIDSLVTFRSSFSGAGRSPAGLASALSGTGDVTMPNGFVRGIDAKSFAAELASSPTTRDVERLLRRGFTGSDLIFSGATGDITIAEGTMTFGPVPFDAGDVRGAVKTIVELSSGGIDLSVDIGLKSLADIPPIEVVYAGGRDRLERTVDASELKARLSSAELRQNMEKLEKLQREQMDLFAEEDRQVKDTSAALQAVRQASLRNRERAEQAALKRKAEAAAIAGEGVVQRERDELRRRAEVIAAQRKAAEEREAADAARRMEQLRFEIQAEAQRRNELRRQAALAALQRKLDEQRQAAEAERRRQEEARKAAEEARLRREDELRRQAEMQRQLDEERKAAEAELRRLQEEARLRQEEEQRRRATEAERQRRLEEERKAAEAERVRKLEEERKAAEAELRRQAKAAERQRQLEEAREAAEAELRRQEEERKAAEEALTRGEELQRQAEAEEAKRQAELRRKAEEAALLRKLEEERIAAEAARLRKLEEERQAAEAALRRQEEERRAAEEARLRQEAELRRQAEEAERLRKVEEERVAAEAEQRRQEEARQAAEAERLRKLEEERQAAEAEQRRQEEARRVAEAARMREEAELRRQEAELERKLEEKRKAAEAERLRRLEEEKKAAEAENRRREEAQRQAAEAERLRKLEEQKLAAEAEQRRQEEARQAAEAERLRKLEEQRLAAEAEQRRKAEARQAAEAERQRQAEADRLKDISLREMNARELLQHQQRAAAWTLEDQRAKELAAKKVIEDAQAKINEILRTNPAQPTSALPAKAPPLETKAISPPEESAAPDMPPAEPLPVGEDAAGPVSISPDDTMTSATGGQAEANAAPQSILPSAAPEPTFLQRFQRLIRSSGEAKERAKIRKRQNFNR
jgi:hypothetical protein